MTTDTLSLYIHFPWCVKKCPYCDFNSHELKSELDENTYTKVLIKDLENDLAIHNPNKPIGTIFMGGGTPSLFSGTAMGQLLRQLGERLDFAPDIEVTMEVNPGAVEHDRFETYLQAGINRLSFGAQSFNDSQLKALGRIHKSRNISGAVTAARRAGYQNFNIDLMYGLPGQSVNEALNDCQQAIDLSPPHLSLYQLTIEPNTLFDKYPPILPPGETSEQIQNRLICLTQENEYLRYEVSAYSKPGYQSQHNLNYWEFGDYLGIGAGAHSKLNIDGVIKRIWKQKHPANYMKSLRNSVDVANSKVVPTSELLFEFAMNALRLTNGFHLSSATKATGLSRADILTGLDNAINQNWVHYDPINDRIKCTTFGYRFLDEILVNLLPD
ncbi:MAG: radical SAM family heme chaperone HemW [Gammaproteobacteria bacterium]|nr:radical SAM family heme chaperone HemW [Gammaproteobacteria bacterium]